MADGKFTTPQSTKAHTEPITSVLRVSDTVLDEFALAVGAATLQTQAQQLVQAVSVFKVA